MTREPTRSTAHLEEMFGKLPLSGALVTAVASVLAVAVVAALISYQWPMLAILVDSARKF